MDGNTYYRIVAVGFELGLMVGGVIYVAVRLVRWLRR